MVSPKCIAANCWSVTATLDPGGGKIQPSILALVNARLPGVAAVSVVVANTCEGPPSKLLEFCRSTSELAAHEATAASISIPPEPGAGTKGLAK